jgi:phospholipid/cholesterol/gamma-HCH transport system substrate-binding protein
MRIETKVGVFVVIALFMLFGLTTQVGSFKFGQKSGYPMIIQLDNANGLEKNANVKSRGIVIGYIDSFSLDVDSVKVNSVIYDGYNIPIGSIASIKQESMLGVKYIDIEFSNEKTFIAYNAELSKNKTYASFDDMSNSINDAATSFNIFIKRLDDLIAKNEKNFTQLIANFKDVGI